MNLQERIGIDRSVLCNFEVLKVDTEKLKNNIGEKIYTKVVYDDKSPVELDNGKRIGKLVIKDSQIGKLTVSFEKNNLNGKQYVNSSLEMMVSGDNNNIQNLNAAEYQTRIIDVFDELEDRYGVTVDYSTIKLKKLELNATFFLLQYIYG